jgi:hypothetical protein
VLISGRLKAGLRTTGYLTLAPLPLGGRFFSYPASSLQPPFGSIWLIEAVERCRIAVVPTSGLWENTISVTAPDNQAIDYLESDGPPMGETDWLLDWTLKLSEQKLGLGSSF